MCHNRFAFRCVLRNHLKAIHQIENGDEHMIKHVIDMSEDLVKLKDIRYAAPTNNLVVNPS